MKLDTKYNIENKVRIKEIEKCEGRIISIWITSIGLQYEEGIS